MCHNLLLLYLLSCLHMSAANVGAVTGIWVELCVLITVTDHYGYAEHLFFLHLTEL